MSASCCSGRSASIESMPTPTGRHCQCHGQPVLEAADLIVADHKAGTGSYINSRMPKNGSNINPAGPSAGTSAKTSLGPGAAVTAFQPNGRNTQIKGATQRCPAETETGAAASAAAAKRGVLVSQTLTERREREEKYNQNKGPGRGAAG
jgi:hypothetical protein